MIKIDSKITGYEIAKGEAVEVAADAPETMHEGFKRPEVLRGATYKVKPPESVSSASLYITVNDVVLNPDTDSEEVHPFEVFINCKDSRNFQWMVALTRLMSAVFRKGGDVAFLVEQLESVFDPNGGYWQKGEFIPSLPAAIGSVIKRHLEGLAAANNYLQAVESAGRAVEEAHSVDSDTTDEEKSPYPESASVCLSCRVKAVMVSEGCSNCLACGDSKCG